MRTGPTVFAAIAILGVCLAPRAGAEEPELVHHLPRWPVKLQRTVSKQYKNFSGQLHLYVEDVPSGVKYTHNASTPTYLASVVKIPFMIELMRQVEAKKISLDETIVYSEDDVRDGSPVFNYVRIGTPIPIRVALEAMIQQSDNAASDIIARIVGIERVNQGLSELGYAGFGPITSLLDVRRLVYRNLDPRVDELTPRQVRAVGFAHGGEARALKLTEVLGELPGTFTIPDIDRSFREYYASGYNSASMEAIGGMLRDLAKGKIVSKAASQTMIEVMLGTTTGARRLVGRLPVGTPVAHKTGTQYRRLCDVGLMYVDKNHPVVFAACLHTGRSQARAEEVIATVADKAFRLLRPKKKRARLAKGEPKGKRRARKGQRSRTSSVSSLRKGTKRPRRTGRRPASRTRSSGTRLP